MGSLWIRTCTLRTRARQFVGFALIVGAYLCTGAAWKVLMVLRHPAPGEAISNSIQSALSPYSAIPVGYVLGTRFGMLARSLRMASQSWSDPSLLVRSERLDRRLSGSRGAWADVARYHLASILERPDADPGRPAPHLCMVLRIDSQRWGRVSVPQSPSLSQAMDFYRGVAADFPTSPVAADSLLALADLEQQQWAFADEQVCRSAAAALSPKRSGESLEVVASAAAGGQQEMATGAAFALFLQSTPGRRQALLRPLIALAQQSHASDLERWLRQSQGRGPGVSGSTSAGPDGSPTHAICVTIRGQPAVGVRVAALEIGKLHSALQSEAGYQRRLQDQSRLDGRMMARSMGSMNPARADDPLRMAAAALISPVTATRIVQALPTSTVGPDGQAIFPGPASLLAGLAVLIRSNPGARDVSIAPASSGAGPGLQFAPRVHVLPTVLRSSAPPLLRWRLYPGAESYRVSVTLAAPGRPQAPALALSPDWDQHTLWWRDGVRDSFVRMTSSGFTGPASDLSRNGLWAGYIYRVVVVAVDGAGRPISTSIGLFDHAEEYFRPGFNWLALRDSTSRVPARTSAQDGLRWMLHSRRPHPAGSAREPARQGAPRLEAPEPIDDVLDLARSQSQGIGDTGRQAALAPVAPNSPAAVWLAPWAALPGGGQGPIPLDPPLLSQLMQSPGSAGTLLAGTFGP